MQFKLSAILASTVAMSFATLASASPILIAEPEAIVAPTRTRTHRTPKTPTLFLTRPPNVLRNPRPSIPSTFWPTTLTYHAALRVP
ncbi:hypothetical protein NMY22_g2250 [Coprinellus aureogranulatus]|nr:hypothetical protein NMY22_g2250 [Coprinellus aureogranulatus]